MEYQVVLNAFETAFTFDYHYPVPYASLLRVHASKLNMLTR